MSFIKKQLGYKNKLTTLSYINKTMLFNSLTQILKKSMFLIKKHKNN